LRLNRILVIRGGAIGDLILILPAIRALRDANPHAHIEILGYKHIAALAENRYYAQCVRSIESSSLSRFFAKGGDLPIDWTQYFAKFDLIVSYLYDPDLIFETNLNRAGVEKVVHGPAKIEGSSHAAQQLARPIQELGVPVFDLGPRLFPSSLDRRRAASFLAGMHQPSLSPTEIVTFHPGSGSEKKNWPLEKWIGLGNHFLKNTRGALIIISGEADQHQIRELEMIWRDPRVRFAKDLPLTDLAATLENKIFVGHDSGISHLAAAAGANCTLLFGPTDSAVWAPRNANARVIRAPDGDLKRLEFDVVRAAFDQAFEQGILI
jgi:ADP-heptose:LPS heptosyltransferase